MEKTDQITTRVAYLIKKRRQIEYKSARERAMKLAASIGRGQDGKITTR